MEWSNLNEFVSKYPKLFRGNPPPVPSGIPLGWCSILDRCLFDLEELAGDEVGRVNVVQIKEKFGELVLYFDISDAPPTFYGHFSGAITPGLVEALGDNAQVSRQGGGVIITVPPKNASTKTDPLFARVRKLTMESRTVCQTCGEPGRLMTNQAGWWYTSCENHRTQNSVVVPKNGLSK